MAENSTNGASPHFSEESSADRDRRDRLNLSPDSQSPEAIQAWLVSRLSDLLGIDPREIDVREPFASYGLGSTEMVGLSGELADWLGRQISPALPYECPTVETLARHLAGSTDPAESAGAINHQREASSEPIAIIGLGCRFPGAADPRAFWQLLRDGVDAITEVPADRFKLEAFYDPDPAAPGKTNTRWGGFLRQVDQFDPHFFGISPREAARMDPQQRLLLEVAWEALQDAGQVTELLAGTDVGVFIGISNNDYGRTQFGDPRRIDAYAGTGNALSIAANRISYLFDFRGPSMAVDTACSSSLVAVHLACRSLWNGESNLALAGGVNLILSPAITINFTKAGVMAPDGRCKAFDSRANGYVRSEGAGVVVLKPLSKALADGDPIYAVVRGSAVNQDGRSNGLMAPNPPAQEAVLREAYRRAGVSPGDIQYVEAHGTGTLLGDPIEVKALGAVLGLDRPAGRLCALGAVKTNIGHLEAAAGIAGLIKVALALKHREIPPNLHFVEPNPHIPFDELPLRVQTTPGPWPVETGRALAGVSSFGFGGTNAHVVLEEAPQPGSMIRTAERGTENSEIDDTRSPHLLPLSARSAEALQALARSYQDFLVSESEVPLNDICYSAGTRRDHHAYRLAATGYSRDQLSSALQAFLRGETHPGLSSGCRDSSRQRKLVFVFPGQGSQWFGMGRRLLEQEPVFREAVERCDRAMRQYGNWSLLGELTATDPARSRLNEIDIIQPVLFAIQVALAALWRSWGVQPQAVVGHSMGEAAAAYVAGAMSLEDAARVICHRSRLVRRTVGRGAMAAVELSMKEAHGILAGYENRVSIAASNSPNSTVLSGDPAALEAILDQLRRRDIFCAMVKVDFASHSPQMDPLRADLLDALEGLAPRPAEIPIYSTVTGMAREGIEFDGRYWARNLREPVLFSGAVQRLLEDGYDTFVEISPHPALLSAIQQGLNHLGREGAVVASMRRDDDERAVMLGSLGALYSLGYPVDWSRIYPRGGRCVRLPPHPWRRERCWMEIAAAEDDSRLDTYGAKGRHPLLGRHFKSAHPAETHFWEITLDRRALPYLDDHRIQGVAVLPASAYLEMVLAAAVEIFGEKSLAPGHSFTLNEIGFHRALFLPDDETRLLQLVFSPSIDGAVSFKVHSCPTGTGRSGKPWTLHVTGRISSQADGSALAAAHETPAQIQARCPEQISGQDYYARLSANDIHYGPFLRSITQLWRHDGNVLAEMLVTQRPETELSAYPIHPAILDGCLQVAGAAVAAEAIADGKQDILMPTRIDVIRVHGRSGPRLWCHARLQERNDTAITEEVRLLDEAGHAIVDIAGLRFESLESGTGHALEPITRDNIQNNTNDWLYEFQWQRKERVDEQGTAEAASHSDRGSWLIFADSEGVGEALALRLKEQGTRSVMVAYGDSYEAVNSTYFRIRPERPEDLSELFAVALPANQPPCRRIVHLWSLNSPDVPASQDTNTAWLANAQSLGCGAALQLVQELARQELARQEPDRIGLHDPPSLWLVTRGTQAVEENPLPLNVAQAPLWGLGRVIAQEHAASWGGLIDLEAAASPPDTIASQLWEEISNPDGEDQIAFRQGQRYVGRLVRKHQSVAQRPPLEWATDGSYLITGGLGDLGLAVARWMVAQGARRLILLGRTKLPPRSSWSAAEAGSRLCYQAGVIRELEALGASVHLASVDVADEAQLSAFLKTFGAEGWPPIRGVVHAAGVLRDGLLSQLDQAALNTVLRPKMMGGWLLHRLLENAPLDFFVLFSSAGSLLGQPGQGNYAAANAFLDALAHHRKAQGRPALSVNWGAWAGLGFADTSGGKRLAASLALVGVSSMASKQALEVLARMLRQDAAQVAAVPVDWRQYHRFYSGRRESPLLSQLANEDIESRPQATPPGERREALLAAEPSARLQLLRAYLSEQVSRVLGFSASRLDVEQPIGNLGLDSLMAVELKNRIAVDLGVNVPMVKFLQGPSVAQAAVQILDQFTAELSTPAALSAPSVVQPWAEHVNGDTEVQRLAQLDQLSDEEVNSLLTELLDKAEISE